MRTLLTNTRMAVVVSAAMALLVAPLGAQTRHGGARLPSRPVVRQEAAHRGDAHDRPGKGKAKGKHKNHRDRYVVIDGRVCRVKETRMVIARHISAVGRMTGRTATATIAVVARREWSPPAAL